MSSIFFLSHSSSYPNNFWLFVMRDAIYKNFKGILLSLAVGPRQKYDG